VLACAFCADFFDERLTCCCLAEDEVVWEIALAWGGDLDGDVVVFLGDSSAVVGVAILGFYLDADDGSGA